MPKGFSIAPSEAALYTEGGCERLALAIPAFKGNDDVPILIVFLMACLARHDHDPGFAEAQIEWFRSQFPRVQN